MKWKPYDPRWLAELAAAQRPDLPWLEAALKTCTLCSRESRAYLHFVDPSRPNEPRSSWQFRQNVVLEHPEEGELVLDVLGDGRVGGVEFLSRLLKEE